MKYIFKDLTLYHRLMEARNIFQKSFYKAAERCKIIYNIAVTFSYKKLMERGGKELHYPCLLLVIESPV